MSTKSERFARRVLEEILEDMKEWSDETETQKLYKLADEMFEKTDKVIVRTDWTEIGKAPRIIEFKIFIGEYVCISGRKSQGEVDRLVFQHHEGFDMWDEIEVDNETHARLRRYANLVLISGAKGHDIEAK